MEYCFEEFKLEAVWKRLLKNGIKLQLMSKHVHVLQVLIEAKGPVARGAILDDVWSSENANENSVDVAISALRKALGDSADQQHFIVTVPGYGYGFAGTLKSCSDSLATLPPLTEAESREIDRSYRAFTDDGLDDEAMERAKQALSRASTDGMRAHWAHRVADACRTMVLLHDASFYGAQAWGHAQRALKTSPDDPSLRFTAGAVRFSQIMVDDYFSRGAFAQAHSRHSQLLTAVREVQLEDVPDHIRGLLDLSVIHIKRQQAEMLRLLGHYDAALSKIREAIAEYPESQYEPRAYARISEADSLRQLGKVDESLIEYKKLEALGRGRNWFRFLGSVLWRKALAHQMRDQFAEHDDAVDEAIEIADLRPMSYRFPHINALLANSAGVVRDHAAAVSDLDVATTLGPLRSDHLALQFAHSLLCRGELSRSRDDTIDARRNFREAFDCYGRMECRWGIVRSWIGLRVTGVDVAMPVHILKSLEGFDAKLLEQFAETDSVSPGGLSMSLI